jgi:hypothetical protein
MSPNWKHLKTIDEPFEEEEFWCEPKENCKLCNERRKRKKKQAATAEEAQ